MIQGLHLTKVLKFTFDEVLIAECFNRILIENILCPVPLCGFILIASECVVGFDAIYTSNTIDQKARCIQ